MVGEHTRKIVSLVRPYLATHFIAASGIESVGSPQANQQRVDLWRCYGGRRSEERHARRLAAYGAMLHPGSGRSRLCPVKEAEEALGQLPLDSWTLGVCSNLKWQQESGRTQGVLA